LSPAALGFAHDGLRFAQRGVAGGKHDTANRSFYMPIAGARLDAVRSVSMGEPIKNIVICCDGTGNDYSRTPSNVWRLRDLLQEVPGEQHVCYEPGIGTLDLPQGRTRLGRRLRHWRELAFGAGFSGESRSYTPT